eukprot:SAG31_NODE_31600_length_366_cov_0.775281_1_plen_90_part_00
MVLNALTHVCLLAWSYLSHELSRCTRDTACRSGAGLVYAVDSVAKNLSPTQQLVGMGVVPAFLISKYMGMSAAAKEAEELAARDAAESA